MTDSKTRVAPVDQHDREKLVTLLERVSMGDRQAFAALYHATSRKLYGIVLRILGRESVAEEILQEVYLKIWGSAASFDPSVASPITWMAAIARNRALDEVRKRQPSMDDDDSTLASIDDDSLTPSDSTEMTQELERLHRCLQNLVKPRDEMILLAYLYGYSRDTLASKYQQPVGTIKTWLHRSLKQLKDCLGT